MPKITYTTTARAEDVVPGTLGTVNFACEQLLVQMLNERDKNDFIQVVELATGYVFTISDDEPFTCFAPGTILTLTQE